MTKDRRDKQVQLVLQVLLGQQVLQVLKDRKDRLVLQETQVLKDKKDRKDKQVQIVL